VSFINGIVNLFRFDKTNWRAVALCLVAATVFWFFNALNKEHTATISIPVDFKYNESVFIPVKSLPKNVLINITGIGWDVLRKSIGVKVEPLQIALDRPSEIKKLPPGSILALATAQFDQLKINHVASDTLRVSIDRRQSRKIKLYVTKDQFRFDPKFGRSSKIIISPDSILLSGPTSILKQIPDSLQLQLLDEVIDENVNTEGEIILPIEDGVTMNVETARVRFRVSNLVEQTKKIKIVVFPAPPFRHQLSTDSVIVSFKIPNSLSDSLTKTNTLFAVVDLRDFEAGITKAIPSIKGSVPFAQVIRTDSVTVKKY
jgi:heme/copper-type cytochrome/quinol oxidase subunit 2